MKVYYLTTGSFNHAYNVIELNSLPFKTKKQLSKS
jgi:hypothetical protein